MRSPDELGPDELDARWNDLTRRLGPLEEPRVPRPVVGHGPRDYAVEDDDGAFVAPEPRKVAARPRSVLGWFLLAFGLTGVMVVALTHATPWTGVLFTALAATGLGVLLTGLPPRRDTDDDGAQV